MEHYLENVSSQTPDTRFLLPSEAWEEFQIASSTTVDALN
jgi:basic membrane lipoprotein Med (substrate-binding protein (PBP1-ABC) superfamily)